MTVQSLQFAFCTFYTAVKKSNYHWAICEIYFCSSICLPPVLCMAKHRNIAVDFLNFVLHILIIFCNDNCFRCSKKPDGVWISQKKVLNCWIIFPFDDIIGENGQTNTSQCNPQPATDNARKRDRMKIGGWADSLVTKINYTC